MTSLYPQEGHSGTPQPPEGIRPVYHQAHCGVEEDGTLPFLDTLARRREGGGLDIAVYRKHTHTDRYLHFQSHHPAHVKRGLVKCLHDRAKGIMSSQDKLQKEVDHLAMESPLAEWLSCQPDPQHLCPTPPGGEQTTCDDDPLCCRDER